MEVLSCTCHNALPNSFPDRLRKRYHLKLKVITELSLSSQIETDSISTLTRIPSQTVKLHVHDTFVVGNALELSGKAFQSSKVENETYYRPLSNYQEKRFRLQKSRMTHIIDTFEGGTLSNYQEKRFRA